MLLLLLRQKTVMLFLLKPRQTMILCPSISVLIMVQALPILFPLGQELSRPEKEQDEQTRAHDRTVRVARVRHVSRCWSSTRLSGKSVSSPPDHCLPTPGGTDELRAE